MGDDAVLEIELDGSAAGGVTGLTLQGSNSVVRGLVINRFVDNGIDSEGDGDLIAGNFIGTDPTGTIARGNGLAGIISFGGLGDRIGGTSPADRNILSANNIGVQVLTPPRERPDPGELHRRRCHGPASARQQRQ